MTVADIYEAMNSKAEAFFEWLQAHPKRAAVCSRTVCRVACRIAVPLEMGVSLAI